MNLAPFTIDSSCSSEPPSPQGPHLLDSKPRVFNILPSCQEIMQMFIILIMSLQLTSLTHSTATGHFFHKVGEYLTVDLVLSPNATQFSWGSIIFKNSDH